MRSRQRGDYCQVYAHAAFFVSMFLIASLSKVIAASSPPSPSSSGIYLRLDAQKPIYGGIDRLPEKESFIRLDEWERLVCKGIFSSLSVWSDSAKCRKMNGGLRWNWPLQKTMEGDLDLLAYYQLKFGDKGIIIGVERLPVPRPVPSYFHRMSDPRILQYYDLTRKRRVSKLPMDPLDGSRTTDSETSITLALLDLSKKMVADNPTDPFTEVFYMDALANARDAKALREELQKWDSQFEKQPMLRVMKRRMETTMQAIEISAKGRNAFDLYLTMNEKDKDYNTKAKMYLGIFNCDGYAQPYSLIPINYGSYLNCQINAKVFETGATMFLLLGHRQQALDLSAADYRFGQLMSQNDTLINRLLGIAVRKIAAKGLQLYYLNACERPEDVQAAWAKLEQLNNLEKPQTAQQMFWLEPAGSYIDESEWKGSYLGVPIEEYMTRQSVADARFQLVRMSASAWYVFLKTGRFPAAAGQFELLPNGLPPKDPFGDDTLRFKENESELACYSIGPDRKDGFASIDYDPTNGTISAGDIVTKVPRTRKYPFPRDGVKAADKADFMRQFPNNLPPDLFADKKGTPLGVTDTSPVCVYSFGPDTDQSIARPLGAFPDTLYDPTNGTISKGDLWCVIPGR